MFEKFRLTPVELFKDLRKNYNAEVMKQIGSRAGSVSTGKRFKLHYALSNKTEERLLEIVDGLKLANEIIFAKAKKFKDEDIAATQNPTTRAAKKAINIGQFQQQFDNLEWYRNKKAFLNDKKNWDRWLNECRLRQEHDVQIRMLRDQWEAHGRYSDFHVLALIDIYERWLPELTGFVVNIEAEFNDKKEYLLTYFAKAYRQYINEYRQNIENEKQQIRHALLARLEAGAKAQDITLVDVTLPLVKQLEERGVKFEPEKRPKHPARGISSITFSKMKNIIERDGTASDKIRLTQLPYYSGLTGNANLKAKSISTTKGTILVPEKLASEVPTSSAYQKLPFFIRLFFREARFKQEFVNHPNYQFLLAASQNLPILNSKRAKSLQDLKKLIMQSSWSSISSLEIVIKGELDRYQALITQRSQLYFGKGIEFIRKNKNYILGLGNSLLNERIKCIRELILSCETIKDELCTNKIFVKSIRALIKETYDIAILYDNNIARESINEKIAHLKKIEAYIAKKQNIVEPVTESDTAIRLQAEQLTKATISPRFNIERTLEEIKADLDPAANADRAYAHVCYINAKAKALSEFIALRKSACIDLDKSQFIDDLSSFFAKGLLAKDEFKTCEAPIEDEMKYTEALYTYFARLLEKIMNFKSKAELIANASKVLQVENYLLQLNGQDQSLLVENIKELQELRDEVDFSWKSYQLACKRIVKGIFDSKKPSELISMAEIIRLNNPMYNSGLGINPAAAFNFSGANVATQPTQ